MRKLKLSAVVFDCDGVLIESNAVKALAFGQTVEAFGQEAMERFMDYHRAHGGISRFEKFKWFYREVIRTPLSDDMMEDLCNRFAGLCKDAVIASPMVAGAKKSLDLLAGRLPMFVASGTPQKELEAVLTEKQLAPYFKGIHGTPPEKHRLLGQILRENRLDPSAVIMVGDAKTDLDAAMHCRTLFYGRGTRFSADSVPWGRDLSGFADYLSSHFAF